VDITARGPSRHRHGVGAQLLHQLLWPCAVSGDRLPRLPVPTWRLPPVAATSAGTRPDPRAAQLSLHGLRSMQYERRWAHRRDDRPRPRSRPKRHV